MNTDQYKEGSHREDMEDTENITYLFFLSLCVLRVLGGFLSGSVFIHASLRLTLSRAGAYRVALMRNARHMVAVMVVATALCADRAAAEPSQRAGMGDVARQLANRISVNFRRVVPAVRIQFATRTAFVRPCELPAIDADQFVGHPWALSPFQFRLPPPSFL